MGSVFMLSCSVLHREPEASIWYFEGYKARACPPSLWHYQSFFSFHALLRCIITFSPYEPEQIDVHSHHKVPRNVSTTSIPHRFLRTVPDMLKRQTSSATELRPKAQHSIATRKQHRQCVSKPPASNAAVVEGYTTPSPGTK